MSIDLNCDLGEGESAEQTIALMAYITSANIACGGHAGDEVSMRHAIVQAQKLGIHIGAHPGIPGHFGRSSTSLSPAALTALLDEQMTRFQRHVSEAGAILHHIKLHGILYHLTETDPSLREAYVCFVKQHFSNAVIYALAGGHTIRDARAAGLTAWDEAFGDRGYQSSGALIPRDQPGALLLDPAAITKRIREIGQGFITLPDRPVPLQIRAQTICIHGDSPQSLTLLQAATLAL